MSSRAASITSLLKTPAVSVRCASSHRKPPSFRRLIRARLPLSGICLVLLSFRGVWWNRFPREYQGARAVSLGCVYLGEIGAQIVARWRE
eukprot:2830692-Pyramimonas_sp.AAC.1